MWKPDYDTELRLFIVFTPAEVTNRIWLIRSSSQTHINFISMFSLLSLKQTRTSFCWSLINEVNKRNSPLLALDWSTQKLLMCNERLEIQISSNRFVWTRNFKNQLLFTLALCEWVLNHQKRIGSNEQFVCVTRTKSLLFS